MVIYNLDISKSEYLSKMDNYQYHFVKDAQ